MLLAINKGKGAEYKRKTFDELEFSDNVESDSDVDLENDQRPSTSKIKIYKNTSTSSLTTKQTSLSNISENAGEKINIDYSNMETTSDEQEENLLRKKTNMKIEQKNIKITHEKPCKNQKKHFSDGETTSGFEEEFSARPKTDLKRVPKKTKITRQKWNEEQKKVIREHFETHIKKKISPKKHEVESFKSQHKNLFKSRNWLVIKAFVYNCYRSK